jgi:hypothetical protein
MYQIEGTFTAEDYLHALKLGRHGTLFSNNIARVLLYILLGILLLSTGYLGWATESWSPIISVAFFMGVVVAMISLFFVIYIPNRAKKIFDQQKELHLPFKMRFGEDGLHFENSIGQATRPWEMFVKWKEDKNILMLYHSDVMFSMLPKRLMNDETIVFVRDQLKKKNVPEK